MIGLSIVVWVIENGLMHIHGMKIYIFSHIILSWEFPGLGKNFHCHIKRLLFLYQLLKKWKVHLQTQRYIRLSQMSSTYFQLPPVDNEEVPQAAVIRAVQRGQRGLGRAVQQEIIQHFYQPWSKTGRQHWHVLLSI